MNSEPHFVDTNILVYAADTGSPFHERARTQLSSLHSEGCPLWISRQVLREYLATMTRSESRMSRAENRTRLIEDAIRLAQEFRVANEDERTMSHLLQLLARYDVGGVRVHDANIVATMQVLGIRNLLTHNLRDFEPFRLLIKLVPLVADS